jgi:hypothetical protein
MKKNSSPNILLVEGVNDQAFFEKLCKVLDLNVDVEIGTPLDYLSTQQGGFNSKQGVLNSLDIFLPLLEDEESSVKKLALVLDADITGNNNGGFIGTITQIKGKTDSFDYSARHVYKNGGVEIPHSDSGMNSLGIWIMPNNKDDGTIENWIKDKILDSEKPLLEHACKIVSELPEQKFSPTSVVKAEIATWLAWQNQPGRTISYALKKNNELLNINDLGFRNLIEWLEQFFKD